MTKNIYTVCGNIYFSTGLQRNTLPGNPGNIEL